MTAWLLVNLFNYDVYDSKFYSSYVELIDVDCEDVSYYSKKTTLYKLHGGGGEVVGSWLPEIKTEYPAPGTIGHAIVRGVCQLR